MMRIIRTLVIIVLLLSVLAVAAQDEDYRVSYGDTLDVIAQEFDVSVACLAEANELTNANTLSFGQMLTIPGDCDPYDEIESVIISNMANASGSDDEAADDSGQGGGAVSGDYRVGYGDTLDVIAQEGNVSVACLIAANDLTNANDLSFGQMLLIPDDCSPYDAMESVILSNIDDLEAAGFTESDMGQGGGGGTADDDDDATDDADANMAMAADDAPLDEVYVVQSGDSLTKIAEEFGVTANCLQQTNRIVNPDLIFSGQELLISGDCQVGGGDASTINTNFQCFGDGNPGRVVSGGVYTVRQGDTLDFIGCDLNMNTACLVAVNDLDQQGGRIAIGQRLTISGQCAGWVAP